MAPASSTLFKGESGRLDFLVECTLEGNRWEVVRIVGPRGEALDYARRVWLNFPQKRPDVRVRRVGSSFASDWFKGGVFRWNFGKWQRIPVRRLKGQSTPNLAKVVAR